MSKSQEAELVFYVDNYLCMTYRESCKKLCKNLLNKLFVFPHTPPLSYKKILYISLQYNEILFHKLYVGSFKLCMMLIVSYYWLEKRDNNFCYAKMFHIYHKFKYWRLGFYPLFFFCSVNWNINFAIILSKNRM